MLLRIFEFQRWNKAKQGDDPQKEENKSKIKKDKKDRGDEWANDIGKRLHITR